MAPQWRLQPPLLLLLLLPSLASSATSVLATEDRRVALRGGRGPGVAPPAASRGAPSGISPPWPAGNAAAPQRGQPTTVSNAPRGRLLFLFLVYDKINNEEIWQRFFANAVQGVQYRAFVHCKTEALCRQNVRRQHIFEIIPSVETQYCADLVSGMNALLRAALQATSAGSPYDKMVFVSDSTLPVKPFAYVQQRLTANTNSDFCIFPRTAWAEVSSTFPGDPLSPAGKVGVKHHQWIILSRVHAQMAVDRASQFRNLMQDLQLNQQPGYQNTGCLDEYWHFATLFRGLDLTAPSKMLSLPGFNGGPLFTGNADVQGQCDTYLHWSPRAQGLNNNLTRMSERLVNDPGTDVAAMNELRPSAISRFSKSALRELRDSWFLFARKVDDGSRFSGCGTLVEAFDALVFSDPPRDLLGEQATWPGQGTWLDNRQAPVTLMAVDGSVKLAWVSTGTTAKGSYCADRISMTFSNGYKASATLDVGGRLLRWSNGVIWHRVS